MAAGYGGSERINGHLVVATTAVTQPERLNSGSAPFPLLLHPRVGNQREALTGEVVHHGQNAEPPAVGQRVAQKVE
jgi:hypothetical protein